MTDHTFMKAAQGLLAGAAFVALSGHAFAADVVRVGKPAWETVAFGILEVGEAKGFFSSRDIEVQMTVFGGGGAQNQALTANTIDIALSSGGTMALAAKGAPFKAVAEFAGPPLNMAITTLPNSPLKGPEDLKGKSLAVTSNTSLTALLPRQLSNQMGWGPDGIKTVALGATEAQWAGVVSGNVDGLVAGTEFGVPLEEKGQAKVVLLFGDRVKNYITHVVLAQNALMNDKPDVLKRFLAGFLEAVAWTKANHEEAAQIISGVIKQTPETTLNLLKSQVDMLYADGHFRPDDVKAMIDEYMAQNLLPTAPTPDQLYTEAFLPQ
jgi:NitT/TauT family transport system substrate-binding protein